MIKKIRIVDKTAVVTATAEFHPLRQLKDISKNLVSLGFEGIVLFDLLSVNGLTQNRFVSMKFANNGFDRSSFTTEFNVNSNIKNEQDLNAKNDQTFLLGSVLSKDELKEFTH